MAGVRIPAPLALRAARARGIVEVGAGAAFETALELQRLAPQARVVVTDVDPRVLEAPAPLVGLLHDATRDAPDALRGADLVVSVRCPEELQVPIARLARALGADLALRPLKDEWADLAPWRHVAWPDGWRFFASRERREP